MFWQLGAFFVLSIPIVQFSRSFLKKRQQYGFYRFFLFESALALVILNLPFWLSEPFSFLHVVSWLLLTGSIILVVAAVVQLKRVGKPQGSIEATTCLVNTGIYRFIRHPMYGSLLVFGWGAGLKNVSVMAIGLLIALSASAYLTARVEEDEDLTKFGAVYEEYKRTSRWFIPFLL